MSAEALTFGARREPALLPAFILAALVHLFLAAVLFLGVRLQSHPPQTVEVELWEAPSPPPAAPAVEAPKPPPKVEPEPPPVPKPDIAVKAPKPKPKPEPKPAPKKDVEFQKRLNEQLAQEQRTIDEQQREAERREAAARQQAIAAAARARALAAWVDKIRAKIRGNIRLPNDMSGNPETIFDVTQLPTGEVISIRLRQSSGHKGYDDAVERAILKSSPLPKPDQPNLFERQLELRFRPQDK